MLLKKKNKIIFIANSGFSSYLFFILFAGFLFPGNCRANLEIFSPVIEEDVWELETTVSYTQDSDRELDDQFDQVIEIEHAITPRWLSAIGVGFLNGPDMNLEHVSSRFENVFWLTPGNKYNFDAGLYFEYIHRHGSDRLDTVEFKLLLEKQWEDFYGLVNLTLEKELGHGREPGTEPEYALRLKRPLNEHSGVGVEAYGEIDERNHIIGPMFYHETELLGHEFELGMGWLLGLSENAPEGTLLFQIGINLNGE